VEVLLVLAIVVMAAAVVTPSLQKTLRQQQLRRAADQVRIEWARAHIQAMKTGRIQMFRYRMGDRAFRIEPWIADDSGLEGATSDATGFGPTATSDPSLNGGLPGPVPLAGGSSVSDDGVPERFKLPEGITFSAGDAVAESRAVRIEDTILEYERQTEWSRPILFYPDGSSSDAFVVVGNEQQTGIRVELRGLTGTAKVSEIGTVDELASGAKPAL
jgi:type II secretory pathway pseudopilin PulG